MNDLRILPPILAILLIATRAWAGAVGFTTVTVPYGPGPGIEVGLWYPSVGNPRATPVELFEQLLVPDGRLAGRRLPLVVLAHGNGGNFSGHADTALALAGAGFIVAAPTFLGDNYRDQSRALDVFGRAGQFAAVIDFVTASWRQDAVDPARIGAFGFSAGGLTALIAAGGRPDLRRVGPHCAAHPGWFDCRLVADHRGTSGARPAAATLPLPAMPPIRALGIAAPALGFAFDRAGLAPVTQPVQLWEAADDRVLPNPDYAEIVRRSLPRKPELHVVPHAGHFDFLAPCPAALARIAPQICASAPGFDRAGFHRQFDAALVTFFTGALRPG